MKEKNNKTHSPLIDECVLEENQELVTSVLKYISDINSKFNERNIPFQLTMNFLKDGDLRTFAKIV